VLTLENWITAYNKDNHYFDPDYISPQEQIAKLERKNKKLKETNKILKKELVIETLKNAFKNRNYPINVIIHSDKGTQYRFHASLKKEWLYNQFFNTINDVRREVFRYIEVFYNNKRIHSSLGFVSPSTFEFEFFNKIPLLPLSNLLT